MKPATCMGIIFSLLCSPLPAMSTTRVEVYNHRAILKLQEFDFTGAARMFQCALELAPDSLILRINLGLAHFYLADYEQVYQELGRVIARDPREPYAHFLYGVAADREGHTQEAIDHFQRVLEVVPEDPGTYYHLGLISLREEQFEQAVELFERSLRGNPNCLATQYNLGRALIACGRREEGKLRLQRFRELQRLQPPGKGGGMGDPAWLIGKYGQPRELPEE